MQDFFNNQVNIGFSQKPDGNMRVFFDRENKETESNRRKFWQKNKISPSLIVLADLIHDDKIELVNYLNKGKVIKNTDALITTDPKITLALTAADCLIVYIYDPINQVVALIHAGWRGLIKKIIIKTIEKMTFYYKSDPKELKIYISPHIQKCHFEIKEDVLNYFKNYSKYITKSDKLFVDLSAIAKEQLIKSGVINKNIQISSECSYCLKNKYFSYRRNGNKHLETMIAYISLKDN